MNFRILKDIRELEAIVESETRPGAYYLVSQDKEGWSCTCADHSSRGSTCKHIRLMKDQ